ncbi:hypothetical protein J982_3773 [Acinetobacter baumannii 44298_6]|nr:hypothetical protein M213_3006 [Acinetobacter baumannii CI77]EXD15980.1 hypothetical protein J457_2366 [Acinetobacter baumannii 136706]EXD50361.1 hypothetical protein J459_1318 [Acinetobacter baumannii 564012]EXF99624.1 hypothetical protein J711_2381 [Acinetobacter baumannii 1552389]EXG03305.1 hypothetical protein J706_2121 [Acinetobacter baumannii 1488685]EXG25548.1 hypothetical protein J719_2899 [Acinetobacter baumannii 323408]EXG42334.1 hypothetical protein J737_3443 [Acinetobacter baum
MLFASTSLLAASFCFPNKMAQLISHLNSQKYTFLKDWLKI